MKKFKVNSTEKVFWEWPIIEAETKEEAMKIARDSWEKEAWQEHSEINYILVEDVTTKQKYQFRMDSTCPEDSILDAKEEEIYSIYDRREYHLDLKFDRKK